MTKESVFYTVLFLGMCIQFIMAQTQPKDSIQHLDEVVVSDFYLNKVNSSQSIQVFNDSVVDANPNSLVDLLNYNSVLYFKQHGSGQLSTVSFRGTTSSQTAVVWNGININSQLNGSADFATVASNGYSDVSIKSGGGSVVYGSGAIGGSVHLNNHLIFKDTISHQLQSKYGSFATYGINYKLNLANTRWSTEISIDYNKSANDYVYVDSYTWDRQQRFNLNGQYANYSLNASSGFKINDNSLLKLYSQHSVFDRHVSLLSKSETPTSYLTINNRNLISYEYWHNNFKGEVRWAYLNEEYNYFPDIDLDHKTYGIANSMVTKIDLAYQFWSNFKLSSFIDYTHIDGNGSGFGMQSRWSKSGVIQLNYSLNNSWFFDLGFRKEYANTFVSPLLFSLGNAIRFSPTYTLKINGSRNYRIPTFNDLYWEDGGNIDLLPENSYQVELGHAFTFDKFNCSVTTYYNDIKDMIRWIPNSNSIWSPVNTDRVESYGAEFMGSYLKNLGDFHITTNATYAYTVSKNKDTQKQLFYVPFHKATGSVTCTYKRLEINYQQLFNGFVYTTSDNNPKDIIDTYYVSNIGINYDLKLFESCKVGFQVRNALNSKYQSLENRPLPGRNFNLYINLKF